jgi:hypothetical protein
MMTISHLAIHYGLLLLAFSGVVECVRVLRIGLSDMRALSIQGANGPKRIWVVGRLNQSAFLLAVFAVLLTIGARVALASEAELGHALVLTLVVACDAIALVLMLKEVTIRRTRSRLDSYYDASVQEQVQAVHHAHRRSTDPPHKGDEA